MILTSIITIITFLTLTASILFFPSIAIRGKKIATYWIVAAIGAVLLVICRLVPLNVIWNSMTDNSGINPVKILILFFSMTFLSVLLDEVGLFRRLAIMTVKRAKSKQISLFVIMYLLTSILTVFTSNDIVILTLTPFICFFCKNTNIRPIPYLVGEFAAANTWSMMLIIGNPTNIYLATSANINFVEYFKTMAIPTLVAGAFELLLLILIFSKQLRIELSPQEDDFKIKSKIDLVIGIIHLAVCLIFLVISGYLNIEMWLISAICALSLLFWVIIIRIIRKTDWDYISHSLKRLPWQLIPFVVSMFIIVICIDYQGISEKLGSFLGEKYCIWTYGISSFFTANLINNIPMSILFSTLPSKLSQSIYLKSIYASIIGSNVGAFFTPIGALAGIMFTELLDRHDVEFGFKRFIKYGSAVAIPTLLVALLILSFII